MANSNFVTNTTDGTFEADVLKSPILTIVDFWAEWCGPCKALAPSIDAVAEEFQGKLKVCKMDVDSNPGIPARFHIRGIPTVIFFKNGTPVDQLVGNQPKTSIVQTIQKHL